MKIYSELTKKEYATVAECLSAEEEYKAKKAKEEKEKTALMEQRKLEAKEIEEAYKEILEANKKYHKLRDEFVKKYGSFHMTVKDLGSEIPFEMFNWIFNW